jgi:GDP-4-dehydro-6-deoxy-D-mannose reductase
MNRPAMTSSKPPGCSCRSADTEMKTALITGANGFSGRFLSSKLRERNYYLIGLDIDPIRRNEIQLNDYVSLDLRDAHAVDKAMMEIRPDFVFHLAGIFKASENEICESIFLSGLNVLDAAMRFSPSARVLIVGSAAEYGHVPAAELPVRESQICRPVNAYGISKYALTMAARDYHARKGLRVVIARPFNLIGPGLSDSLVVGAILERIKQALRKHSEPVIKVGRTDTERDFLPVADAVEAYIQLLEGEFWGEIFNICSGIPRTIRSVIENLMAFSAKKIRFEEDPSLVRTHDAKISFGSWEKANAAFGFTPKTDFLKTLEAMWLFSQESA